MPGIQNVAAFKAPDFETIAETVLGAFLDEVGAGASRTYAPEVIQALVMCLCYYVDAEASPDSVVSDALEVYHQSRNVGDRTAGDLLKALRAQTGDQICESPTF